jgi:nitronate monooxygenase
MAQGLLHTSVCDLFDIEFPVLLAGMDKASCPALVAAIAEAGGFGVLGAASLEPDELDAWIADTKGLTSRPFGINTLLPSAVPPEAPEEQIRTSIPEEYWHLQESIRKHLGFDGSRDVAREPKMFSREFFTKQLEVILDHDVAAYVAGLGDPGDWIDRFHQHGTLVIGMVGNVRNARRVVESGVDVVVAQGHEAGGHNSRVGTMALVPQVVNAVGDSVPVLAAGGIGDGRGVVASLALGAAGAWLGTRFLATDEACIPDGQKRALIDTGDDDTMVSRYWTGKPARVIRAPIWEELERGGLPPLSMPGMGLISVPLIEGAAAEGRWDLWPGSAGQVAGMIEAIEPAAEVYRRIVAEAEDILRSLQVPKANT